MHTSQKVTEFFDRLNTRDLDGVEDLLKEGAQFYFPKTQPLIGRNRILKFFPILFRQYPELHFEIRRIIVQGESAAVHWTNIGLSRKREPYENEGVTLFELEGGKISFISDFFKDTGKF